MSLRLPAIVGRTSVALAASALAAAVPRPAAAQDEPEGVAHISGQVVVHTTDEPLEGADVVLVDRDGRWITDEDGRFVMPELEPGTVHLRVEFLGYAPAEGEIELEEGVTYLVEVRMDVRPIDVEGFVVTVRPSYVPRRLQEAYDRMDEGGFGYFVTNQDLERRGYPTLAEALRGVPGARVVQGMGFSSSVTFRGGCRPQIYMDGVRAIGAGDLWALNTMDVEVLEVYPSTAGLPPQYRDRNTRCALLVWTRIRDLTP